MTSANISGVMQMQDLITRVNKLSEEIGTGVDFSAMVQQQANATDSLKNETAITDIKPAESKEQANTSYEKQKSEAQAVKSQVREEKRTVNDDIKEKLSGDAKAAGSDIKEKISKVLGVEEEEVVKAMEALGLTVADLFEPKNLGLLAANLTGNEDPAALLISEDFVNLVTEVKAVFTDYAAANEVATEEFVQVLSEMETVEIPTENIEGMDEILTKAAEVNAGAVNESLQVAKDDTIKDKVVTTDENGEVLVTEKTEAGEIKTTVVENGDDSESDFSKESSEDFKKPQTSVGSKNTETTEFSSVAVNAERASSDEVQMIQNDSPVPQTPEYDPQQLISSIVDQAKVAYTPDDNTEIQMVLNPEELGKLMLSVNSSKEGNITAKFVVETEIAKEVLEQQMAVLRDNLNTQGVKVDAVEVTVSSHAFEENLDGEFQREQSEGERAQEQAENRRRNINLDDLSELGGLMSEEEMLVAAIMRDNGNTVNFTA